MKLCLKCNKEFEPHRFKPKQRFCSSKCQKIYWYFKNKVIIEKKICLFCKGEFKPRRIDQLYCNRRCSRRKQGEKKKRIPQKKECKICGKEFMDVIKVQKYCSLDCQKIAHKPIERKFNLMKRKTDINYKLRHNISARIVLAIKKNKDYTKKNKTIKLLGCSILQLRAHLEEQFKEGMNWDNYGRNGWEIDHIIPCSNFDLKEEAEQMKCFNHNNLQPLWKKDNLIKSNKILL